MGGCTAAFNQVAFRGRDDDAGETDSTWKANQNTAWTQPVDENFRVRLEVQETAGCSKNNFTSIQLQYNLNSAGWVNVTATSSVVQSVASATVADGANTTDQLTAGTGTFVGGGGFDEVNGIAGSTAMDIAASGHFEVEYCCQVLSADVADSDTIQLRATDGGSAFAAYSATASLTVSETSTPYSADLTAPSFAISPQAIVRLSDYLAAFTAPTFAFTAQSLTRLNEYVASLSSASVNFVANAITITGASPYVAELTAASFAFTAQAVSRFNDWVGTLSAASVSFTAQAVARVNAWGASLTAPIISFTARAFSWTVSGGEPTLPATAVFHRGKAFLPNGRQCVTTEAVSESVNLPEAVHPVGCAYMTDLNTDPVPANAVFVSGYAYAHDGVAYVTTEARDAGDAFVSGVAVRQDGAVRVTTDDVEEGDAVVSGQRMKQDGTKRIYLT